MHRSLQEVLMLTARHVWGKWPRAVLLGKMVSRLETPSMTRDLTVTDHLQMCEDSQSRENTSVVTEHQMVEAVSCVEESTPQIAQLLGTQLHQVSRIVKQIAARTRANEAGGASTTERGRFLPLIAQYAAIPERYVS